MSLSPLVLGTTRNGILENMGSWGVVVTRLTSNWDA